MLTVQGNITSTLLQYIQSFRNVFYFYLLFVLSFTWVVSTCLSLPSRTAWIEPGHFAETHVLVPCTGSGSVVPQIVATIHAISMEIGRAS